jgi:hypothetical protein
VTGVRGGGAGKYSISCFLFYQSPIFDSSIPAIRSIQKGKALGFKWFGVYLQIYLPNIRIHLVACYDP